MHPDTPIATQDIRADAPAGHDIRSAARWDLARHDYLAGDSGRQVCDRYGLSLSTFNQRARRDGWRKCDQPDPDPVPDDDPEADQPVDCAALAEEALVHVRGALRRGRAGEASSWMRLHEKLLARLEAEAARERRREQVARRQGSNGAEEALANALRPLRERMAFINTLGSAQIRVGRAWSQGHISTDVYNRFNKLHSGAVGVLDGRLAALDAEALAAASDAHCSHSNFSAAPDP
ncbi:MAG: hypothetical protein EON88_05190 [Brevundimonas sp.]|nr:MAG: hypothetical protein EON88_05190 [Brevundimonas sp.]